MTEQEQGKLCVMNPVLEGRLGKLLSPSRRRKKIRQICQTLVVSERRACKIPSQASATQWHHSPPPFDEKEWRVERIKTQYIELCSLWENGSIESFNGKLTDKLLDRGILTTLEEAKILIEQWRKVYNQVCLHCIKNYRQLVPETISTIATT